MNVLKDYIISFYGLKDGLHSFEFQISEKFFEAFENTRIQQSNLKLVLELDKQDIMLQFRFTIDGLVKVECDRCLDSYEQPVVVDELLIIKFGPETIEESENILVLNDKEHEIQLAQYIYEFISLNLPMRLIHPDLENGDEGCSPEFLTSYMEYDDAEQEEEIDPRWDALKKLKDN